MRFDDFFLLQQPITIHLYMINELPTGQQAALLTCILTQPASGDHIFGNITVACFDI